MEPKTEYRNGIAYVVYDDGEAIPLADVMKFNYPDMDFDPATGGAMGPMTPPRADAPQSATPPRDRSMGERAMGLLGDVPNMLNGTGIPERLVVANEALNPVAGIYGAMDASGEMFAPNRTGYERAGSAADMLTNLSGALIPMAKAARGGTSGATALIEAMLGGSPTTQAAGDIAQKFATDESGSLRLFGGGVADPTNTGWTFRDMRKPDLSREENKRLQSMFDRTAWQETELPIGRMIATQPTVNSDFAETLTSQDRLPTVVQKGNELFVRDGHHRLVKAAQAGNTKAKVALLNLDPRTETPLLDYRKPAPWTAEDDALLAELMSMGLLSGERR